MKKPADPPPMALDAGAVPWLLACALATAAPHVDHLPLWLCLLGGIIWLGGLWSWRRRAALLRLAQMRSELTGLFDGSRHGPAPLKPGEPGYFFSAPLPPAA